ncbi:MAG TPA: hypothetical protein GXX28_09635 [Firmicutes bacterium]|nr:hypothetical protein [Bacillota bacterium]
MYRQYNERVGVSLEQGTPAVPDDERYYLRRGEEIVGSYPTLKRAQTAYLKLVREELARMTASSPADSVSASSEKKVDPVKESTERFLDAKDSYWSNAHKYRRGGRLGRR